MTLNIEKLHIQVNLTILPQRPVSAHLAGVRPNIRLGKVRYTLRFEVACQCSLLPVSSFVVRVTHTSDSRKIAVFHNPAYELENQVYPGSSGCFLSFSLSLSFFFSLHIRTILSSVYRLVSSISLPSV